jgi:hypothetical protein
MTQADRQTKEGQRTNDTELPGYSPLMYSYFVRSKCWPLIVALADGPKAKQQLDDINAVSEETVDLLCKKPVSGEHALGGVRATESGGGYTLHPTPFTWQGY